MRHFNGENPTRSFEIMYIISKIRIKSVQEFFEVWGEEYRPGRHSTTFGKISGSLYTKEKTFYEFTSHGLKWFCKENMPKERKKELDNNIKTFLKIRSTSSKNIKSRKRSEKEKDKILKQEKRRKKRIIRNKKLFKKLKKMRIKKKKIDIKIRNKNLKIIKTNRDKELDIFF